MFKKACFLVVLLCLACLLAVPAFALDLLELQVNHINIDDQLPPEQSSAAISAKMVLDFLGNELPLSDILAYGRSQNPTFTPSLEFDELMLAATLNYYVPEPGYRYEVVSASTLEELAVLVAGRMNANLSVSGPICAPAIMPLGGDYDNWVVVTGTRSEQDPYVYPDTTMYGLWLDDPRFYNDYGMNEPNIYYALDPGASPSLAGACVPMTTGQMTGQYISVVPVVPEPGSIMALLVGLGALGGFIKRRK